MATVALRSPFEKVGGLFYFGRMLDKIRLHAKGELPADYHENLGKGFDEKCVTFLRIKYHQLTEYVKRGGSDEEILQWCFSVGRKPSENDVYVWNEFMRKRGWNDEKRMPACPIGRTSRRRFSSSTPTRDAYRSQKLQIPIPKSQRNLNVQPQSNSIALVLSLFLELGISLELESWDLGFPSLSAVSHKT